MSIEEIWPTVLALAVGVLALARAVRLLVDDDWPPVVRVREAYVSRVPERWAPVVECPWCCAPYLALPAVLWFGSLIAWPSWTANYWIWWLVNGWAAASWAASFINMRDIPPESRE